MSLESAAFPVVDRLHLPLAYVDAVSGAGGIPICLPPYKDRRQTRELLSGLHGIVFIGGTDYRPAHYGGHPQPKSELMHPRRDRFDMILAKIILEETELPILGICGGHQLLAIARGGALIQDIGTEWQPANGGSPLPHSPRDKERTAEAGKTYLHSVSFSPHSLVARAMGAPPEKEMETNSFHHQAVQTNQTGMDLVASAWTSDGIIEAIEPTAGSAWDANGRFILGVQWHPERMQDEEPHRRLFRSFIRAASESGVFHEK